MTRSVMKGIPTRSVRNDRRSPGRLSFLTLQRGNAVLDALRPLLNKSGYFRSRKTCPAGHFFQSFLFPAYDLS
ncbi:DUF1534 domain-containing protein [Pseudomonas amygdali pv. lachrymans str. M301315]|uniref:DUF1534 domain-containing protein n=1 Tax=Pseudomonas amygdali pv. lachrymans str. M301315 TaxID=629260 RepID=A0AAD0PTH7_PSEAV|nr:DUF1534 domain-containing protein [Pseudomonas amygdali pv. lachrymans str. M301315]PWD00426.1 hypothetical protein CX658_20705 [Pseudomonas amygdali pv. lachrymans]